MSLTVAGRKVPFMKLKSTPYGQYLIFPMTTDGLVYSVHPTGNPHLHNKYERLAELDLEALKQTTAEDFGTLFGYPNHNGDVQVLPIPNMLGTGMLDGMDIPSVFSKVFEARVLYRMRARRLPEFFQAKPGNYVIIDARSDNRVIMQFKGNPLGPLNLDLTNGPSNAKMRNLFSINLGILKALENIPEGQFKDLEPDEFTISQWGAVIQTVLRQIQIVRWNKGGKERSLGSLADASGNDEQVSRS